MYMYMYIFMYVLMTATSSVQSLSVIVSAKKVTENPSVKREDGHGDCSVSLAAVLLAITKITCLSAS